jgi:hypothetical protein
MVNSSVASDFMNNLQELMGIKGGFWLQTLNEVNDFLAKITFIVKLETIVHEFEFGIVRKIVTKRTDKFE